MSQQLGLDCEARKFPLFDRFAEMGGSLADEHGGDQVEVGHARPYTYTSSTTASLPDSHAGPLAGGIWPLSVRLSYSCAPLGIASTLITTSSARPAPGLVLTRPSSLRAKVTL